MGSAQTKRPSQVTTPPSIPRHLRITSLSSIIGHLTQLANWSLIPLSSIWVALCVQIFASTSLLFRQWVGQMPEWNEVISTWAINIFLGIRLGGIIVSVINNKSRITEEETRFIYAVMVHAKALNVKDTNANGATWIRRSSLSLPCISHKMMMGRWKADPLEWNEYHFDDFTAIHWRGRLVCDTIYYVQCTHERISSATKTERMN